MPHPVKLSDSKRRRFPCFVAVVYVFTLIPIWIKNFFLCFRPQRRPSFEDIGNILYNYIEKERRKHARWFYAHAEVFCSYIHEIGPLLAQYHIFNTKSKFDGQLFGTVCRIGTIIRLAKSLVKACIKILLYCIRFVVECNWVNSGNYSWFGRIWYQVSQ